MRLTLIVVAIVAVACFGAVTGRIHLPGSTPADRSVQIAQEISAESCTASAFEITSKLDDSKTRIYSCRLASTGAMKCVTEENGLAHDQTVIVRLLFADTLSGGKPDCIA